MNSLRNYAMTMVIRMQGDTWKTNEQGDSMAQ